MLVVEVEVESAASFRGRIEDLFWPTLPRISAIHPISRRHQERRSYCFLCILRLPVSLSISLSFSSRALLDDERLLSLSFSLSLL